MFENYLCARISFVIQEKRKSLRLQDLTAEVDDELRTIESRPHNLKTRKSIDTM